MYFSMVVQILSEYHLEQLKARYLRYTLARLRTLKIRLILNPRKKSFKNAKKNIWLNKANFIW